MDRIINAIMEKPFFHIREVDEISKSWKPNALGCIFNIVLQVLRRGPKQLSRRDRFGRFMECGYIISEIICRDGVRSLNDYEKVKKIRDRFLIQEKIILNAFMLLKDKMEMKGETELELTVSDLYKRLREKLFH